jgi:hypothetical protein
MSPARIERDLFGLRRLDALLQRGGLTPLFGYHSDFVKENNRLIPYSPAASSRRSPNPLTCPPFLCAQELHK